MKGHRCGPRAAGGFGRASRIMAHTVVRAKLASPPPSFHSSLGVCGSSGVSLAALATHGFGAVPTSVVPEACTAAADFKEHRTPGLTHAAVRDDEPGVAGSAHREADPRVDARRAQRRSLPEEPRMFYPGERALCVPFSHPLNPAPVLRKNVKRGRGAELCAGAGRAAHTNRLGAGAWVWDRRGGQLPSVQHVHCDSCRCGHLAAPVWQLRLLHVDGDRRRRCDEYSEIWACVRGGKCR